MPAVIPLYPYDLEPTPAPPVKFYEIALRHSELYDPDGDVVLVARHADSGIKQLFRVKSSAFGYWDALARALEERGNVYYRTDEGVEDGPCIEMDDYAEEVAELIRAHTTEAADAL